MIEPLRIQTVSRCERRDRKTGAAKGGDDCTSVRIGPRPTATEQSSRSDRGMACPPGRTTAVRSGGTQLHAMRERVTLQINSRNRRRFLYDPLVMNTRAGLVSSLAM